MDPFLRGEFFNSFLSFFLYVHCLSRLCFADELARADRVWNTLVWKVTATGAVLAEGIPLKSA